MWGFVPRENLLGRAVAILYSPREGISSGRWWIPLRPEAGSVDERLTR
jgi:signal peptidase I